MFERVNDRCIVAKELTWGRRVIVELNLRLVNILKDLERVETDERVFDEIKNKLLSSD